MIALFDCWLPRFAGKRLAPDFRLVLAGDTPDELAWSLVELFQDAMAKPSELKDQDRFTPYLQGDPAELNRALSRTLAYQEARFTPAWWEKQEWRMVDSLSRGSLGKMRIADFQTLFTPKALLSVYLAEMVGKYFTAVYGEPETPLDGRGAIAYFERHRCLKWIRPTDLAAWVALPSP